MMRREKVRARGLLPLAGVELGVHLRLVIGFRGRSLHPWGRSRCHPCTKCGLAGMHGDSVLQRGGIGQPAPGDPPSPHPSSCPLQMTRVGGTRRRQLPAQPRVLLLWGLSTPTVPHGLGHTVYHGSVWQGDSGAQAPSQRGPWEWLFTSKHCPSWSCGRAPLPPS